jgi:hypothetical protein
LAHDVWVHGCDMMVSRCIVKDRLGTTPMDYACGSVGQAGGLTRTDRYCLLMGRTKLGTLKGLSCPESH